MWIVDPVYDRFGGHSPYAVDGLDSLDLSISFGNLVQLFLDGFELTFKALEQLAVQVPVRRATAPRVCTG